MSSRLGGLRFLDVVFVFLAVKFSSNMKTQGFIIRGNWIKDQGASYFVSSIKTTLDDAKKSCSSLNSSLFVIKDEHDAHFLKNNVTFHGEKYWIGLSKQGSDITEVYQNDEDISFTDGECVAAKINSSSHWQFLRRPCNWLQTSFCVRTRRNQEDERKSIESCGEGWTKYGKAQCLLPVYHQINWFAAYVHCKRLNGHILEQEDVYNLSTTSFKIKDYFWIGKRYRLKIDPKTNWTWFRDDVVFSDWSAWQIRIPTVGCHGCGFADGSEVVLDSVCTGNRSAICRFELLDSKFLPAAMKRRSSWSSAETTCRRDLNSILPEFTEESVVKAFENFTSDFGNISNWLGLHKKIENQNNCMSKEVENYTKFTDYTLDKCYSVNCTNLKEKRKYTPCDQLQHPFCFQRKAEYTADKCSEPWQDCKNACCLILDNLQTSWLAAHMFCLQQNGRLATEKDLLSAGINLVSKTASKRCWLANRRVYTPRDPLEGWLWSNGTPLGIISNSGVNARLRYNGKSGRCAAMVEHDVWEDKLCGYKNRYICKIDKKMSDEKNATNMTKQTEMTSREIQATINKTSAQFLKDIQNVGKYNASSKQTYDESAEVLLPIFTNFLIAMVNKSSFNASFEIKKESFELSVFTASLDKVQSKGNSNTYPIPIFSLRKLCNARQTCTIKAVRMKLKSIPLNITSNGENPRSVVGDIITLDYLAEGEIVSELGNDTILLKFDNMNKTENHECHCMYLDGNKWSQGGLTTGKIDDKSVECITNHLTSFSMVIVDAKLDEEEKQIFSLIGYIGSGLSLAALVFTSLVYIFLYNDIQVLSSSRQLVHSNLLVALCGSQIVFLFGGNRSEDEIFCKIVAILLHYFTLASFCWMLLEGVLLYLKLVAVFGSEYIPMKRLLAFGWGFPLVFVAVSAAANIEDYGTDEWCWLSYNLSNFWVFFTPPIIILSLNVIIVVAVIRILYHAASRQENNERQSICTAFRGFVLLFPALGLSWIFGVIAIHHDGLVWKYLFAILNSLQGLLIFLFYGVCNGEIKMALKRRLGRTVNHVSSTT